MENDSARDRVRALVREVLAKAAPEIVDGKPQPQSRFVNTVQESSTQTGVTRDESAQSIITEDDVRGLDSGAVLRIGEDARLTPLAQDIVNEKWAAGAVLEEDGKVHFRKPCRKLIHGQWRYRQDRLPGRSY